MHSKLAGVGFTALLVTSSVVLAAPYQVDDTGPGSATHITNLFPPYTAQPLAPPGPDGSLLVRHTPPGGLVYNFARSGCSTTTTTQPSVTITPPAGQFVYISSVYGNVKTDTTGPTATNGTFTLTNVNTFGGYVVAGSATTLQWQWTAPATSASNIQVMSENFIPPVRSLIPGQAITFAGASAVADIEQCIQITYAFGP